MSFHCPKCNGVVYDRKLRQCGFCGIELPVEFMFSEAELAKQARWEEEARQRTQKNAKDDEAAGDDVADIFPFV